jgi:predicted SprT family Zn-dependent metalloprotease
MAALASLSDVHEMVLIAWSILILDRFDRVVYFQQIRPMESFVLHDLSAYFAAVNQRHFDGFLEEPGLRFNSRLRASAGRFIPGRRNFLIDHPAIIEVATYLLSEPNARELIADIIAHEMIHYWLWVRRLPYGHTAEFRQKMRIMGVSRYNPVPRLRPYRYLYRCLGCQGEFPAKRRLGTLACRKCCKKHSGGRYDSRFKLHLDRRLSAGELSEARGESV